MSSPPKLSKQTWEQLRDWLLPEEAEPQAYLVDGECNPRWDHWRTRRQLRALLTIEADRAERGDG